GCAGLDRPYDGPGSGWGAGYVPMVEPHDRPQEAYQAAVDKCQGWARDIPYIYSGRHQDALDFLGFVTGFAFGFTTPLTGLDLAVGMGAHTGGMLGFGYWTQTYERQAWYARQETMMMNCMTREGYANADPSVKVTWRKI